ASDLAGNSNDDSETVRIDTAMPSISVSHTADGSNGWNVDSPVTETVTASRSLADLDGSPSCTVDDSPVTPSGTGPWTFDVSGDGSHEVGCSATDLAGNSNDDADTVNVDTVSPAPTITAHPDDPTESSDAEFSFSGDDGSGSGVDRFECRLDSADDADYAAC